VARAERPLDEGNSPLLRFAADLRQLRASAGGPAYRELSRQAHYSAAALSDAASGRRLPSLAVTLAFAGACGGDLEAWEHRWREVAAEVAGNTPSNQADENGDGQPPYVGLAAFQADDAEKFFGRDRLVSRLCGQVAKHRFLLLVGPSGSGKSSLLSAGLLHRARAGEIAGITIGQSVVMTPGAHPLEECAARLAAITGGTSTSLHAELRTDPRTVHLTALQALVDRPAASDLLVVVDQFEETFTLCRDPAERAQFVRVLWTAANTPNSRVRVVLGVRADFYAHCAHFPELVEAMADAQVVVGPMTASELRSAINEPAVRAGCRVETALVTQIVADAIGRPGVLPLVSHALLETWRRRRGTTLTLAGYEAAGGITQSIARSAEAVHTSLSGEQRQMARQLFLRLVALGEGTEDTKRRLHVGELDDPAHAAVLERLARARLVTVGQDTVELTHEALIQGWPRLRQWLAEDRDGLRIHRRLTEAAGSWEALHRDPGALYRGSQLAQAGQWAATSGEGALSVREQEFLRASQAAQAHEEAVTHRRTVRLRQLLALVTVLLLVTTTTAAYALQAQHAATTQRDISVSQKVLSQAAALRATNPALAVQLSLAAYRLSPLPEGRSALLNMFSTPYASRLTGHTGLVQSMAFSADGRILATASSDHTVRLWQTTVPDHPRELATLSTPTEVLSAALSPDGHTLATAGSDPAVHLWDTTGEPREFGVLPSETGALEGVTFSPDGRTLVAVGHTGDYHGTVQLWDVTDRTRPSRQTAVTGQFGIAYSAMFTPDGRTLATAVMSAEPTVSRFEVRLWDVTDRSRPRELHTLAGFPNRVSAAFGPDGRSMATAQVNADTATLWDVTDMSRPQAQPFLVQSTGAVTALVFSPDGHTLATAGSDRTVQLWDVTTMGHPRMLTTLTGYPALIYELVFSPDGRTLASAAQNSVRLDDITDYTFTTRAYGAVESVAFSPDGHTLATGNGDGTVRLWDATDPHRLRELASIAPDSTKAPVMAMAYGPDGRWLVTGDVDGIVKIWNATDHSLTLASPVVTTRAPVPGLVALSLSRDGRTLAIASNADSTVGLWDIGDTLHPHTLTIFTGLSNPINSVALSPDARFLAAGGADVKLWDVSNATHPTQLSIVDSMRTLAVAFSPDGRTLATGDADQKVRLWDIDDARRPMATLMTQSTIFVLAFDHDGRTLAAGLADDTTELVDVTDLHRPQTATVLSGSPRGGYSIGSLAFSPDDNALATAGTLLIEPIRGVELWDTNAERAASHICQVAWPVITPAEWDQYFPGVGYRPPCP
jgi:WD40 repeat protein/energy-coupling factor transporter ATP-binding protein EcfA2